VCPDICGQLPEKQRQAAGLAVSMVALTSCEGDIEGAARAVATAAADGDLSAFGAGLSVGAAVLAGGSARGATGQWCLLSLDNNTQCQQGSRPLLCLILPLQQYTQPNV
jgi:hypothetical protein